MKAKLLFSLLVVFTILSCSDDENESQVITDTIVPVTNVPYIIFDDSDDLLSQIESAFPIPNNTDIPSSALERVIEINTDSTELKLHFDVKEEFSNQYSIPTPSFYFLDIVNVLQSIFNVQPNLTWYANSQELTELENVLCGLLPTYDFDNQPEICIPLTVSCFTRLIFRQ